MKRILIAILFLPFLAACPGGGARPNNMIDPAAVRQPFLNIVERHDMYIRAGYQPPMLDPTTNTMIIGPPLSELERSTYLNEAAILKKIILENSGPTLPTPVQ